MNLFNSEKFVPFRSGYELSKRCDTLADDPIATTRRRRKKHTHTQQSHKWGKRQEKNTHRYSCVRCVLVQRKSTENTQSKRLNFRYISFDSVLAHISCVWLEYSRAFVKWSSTQFTGTESVPTFRVVIRAACDPVDRWVDCTSWDMFPCARSVFV